ncbi:Glutamate synthase [NADPH] large chain [Pirellulimonas nuda]|uniref:Glutamate synthase [NADPH] large chain n=1 Tax=Pirellulimonas nuda TaxID=2528009 RepID=A0A518D8J9_9BACT|nr:FMN-binding glutamate synthase family protein [Pirellulimonas nuda]QDU87809.1 Glutamate synthase [NADPH] large chain [Pirellulimonas nuda]
MIFWAVTAFVLFLVIVALYDITQKKHTILRNFPIVGHFRYWLETIGPELRQYIVASNDEERPFSRDQRSWVYASAKHQNNYFGFGTDNDLELTPSYVVIKHSAFPVLSPPPGDPAYDHKHVVPCAKVLGARRGRAKAFRPHSVLNISAMSYGSLSAAAIEALNRGSHLAGCLQNTGEGGVSDHHLQGGDLVWQIGTAYFGCREPDGGFSMDRLAETVERCPSIRAIEVKLSQGAKPGHGGVLPKAKITPEIARIRGIRTDRDCVSPAGHTAFGSADGLLDFVEAIAERTGLPVGIKSAVGEQRFWVELCDLMEDGARGVDFITIDGGEGGTGAAPLVFADHVSLPFKQGFARVYRVLAERGVHDRVVLIGSGKLGLPETAMVAFALGCDMVNLAREAMLSIGCIQAQRCHTNHCPTGVATQNRWLMRGLDPHLKGVRAANYIVHLRKEVLELCHACGVSHPALVTPEHIDIIDDHFGHRTLSEVFGYPPGYGVPSGDDRQRIVELMAKDHTAAD